jgi:DNA-binding XRE family transcriptional regulator
MPRKIEITERDIGQIERMAGLGLTVEKIALVLGVSRRTVFRWMGDERIKTSFEKGRVLAELNVGKAIYEMATVDRNLSAAIWWEKTRLGRSEKQEVSHTHAANEGAGQVVVYLPENFRDSKEAKV